jgi:hypothetical protein
LLAGPASGPGKSSLSESLAGGDVTKVRALGHQAALPPDV